MAFNTYRTGRDQVDFQQTGNLTGNRVMTNIDGRGFAQVPDMDAWGLPGVSKDDLPPVPTGGGYDMNMILQLLGMSGGSSSSSSSGSSTASSTSLTLAAQEALRKRQADAYRQYLSGGQIEQGVSGLRDSLAAIIAAGEGNVEGIYGRTMGNIASGYGAAESLTSQGYGQLASFLAANPNNPYAGFGAEAGAVSNPLEQVLGAYGVDAPEAQAMMAAEQAAGQSGATNFNALVDVLSRSAQMGATSRASESEMARNFAMTSLGQQRGMYESQAAAARQQALSQLAEMRAQREFEIQQAVNNTRQQIEKELLDLGEGVPRAGGGQTSSAVQQLQNLTAAGKDQKLAQRVAAFVEQNPNAGKKKIEAAFPKLGAKIK